MNNEQKRFISMYRAQVQHTLDFVENVSVDRFKEVPIDSDSMFMGTRINTINIGSLIRHMIVAENHWFHALAEVKEGEVVPVPNNASVIEGVADGVPLLNRLSKVTEEGIQRIEQFDAARLNTKFEFVGINYTVMGFLWALYAHHAFHKGQIDLLMRQMSFSPAEYMEHRNPPVLVG